MPTLLDAVKVSYPPDLAGESLLARRAARRPRASGCSARTTATCVASLGPALQARGDADRERIALRALRPLHDPGETARRGAANAPVLREERRELELFRERIDAQLVKTRRLLEGRPGNEALSAEACEKLKALGYVVPGCS